MSALHLYNLSCTLLDCLLICFVFGFPEVARPETNRHAQTWPVKLILILEAAAGKLYFN